MDKQEKQSYEEWEAQRQQEKDEARAKAKPERALGYPILVGLNKLGKNVYGGTVPPAKVAKNREKNKRAQVTRRGQRKR